MKKILVLFSILLLASVTFASAEVRPTVDDDVGIELALFADSVTLDVMSLENYFATAEILVLYPSTGILGTEFNISRDFYISQFLEKSNKFLDIESFYQSKYREDTFKPPSITLKKLSSFCLGRNQVRLRA